nr:MAG TPA: hypothetical protein [Caudoviricetes sp.]
MKITYKNWTFLFSQTESAKPTREQSLSCESISADTLTAVVRCNDPTIMAFAKNDPIRVWGSDSDASMQTYYLRSITRTGATSYRLVAWSAVGLLAAMAHKGGIYTGQTVAEVVKEICGNVPVVVKSVFANTKLYGWLPYCQPKADRRGKSARDNLVHVLFAIGAYLTTDLNGVLHIDALWDGASSTIGSNRMYASGGKVSYSDPVSAVTVTEHQYIAGTDEKKLFSGTSQQGDIITFSEPMHSLTATGFTILESGANYAKISAGSGSLKGKTYIHNTRLVTQTVTENAAENVKSVTDATLVSLVNSSAVAKRLADYYKCRETITNGIVSGQEKPGHVVSVYHPYDKKMVSACIVSLDTTMSGTLKSEMTALVGFLPPQPESTEYYDERVILTGSGEWTVPEGVTSYTRVLIGGGRGGSSGHRGESPAVRTPKSWTEKYDALRRYVGLDNGVSMEGGKGGEPGEAGDGGKVLVETVTDAVPGAKVSYACGTGGYGGVFAQGNDVGAPGTATTMGGATSDTGSSSEAGYTDAITGEVFAAKGKSGIAGSPGNGYTWSDGKYTYQPSPSITVDGVTYSAGKNKEEVEGEDGQGRYNTAPYGYVGYRWLGGYGGGAAAGSNGNDGLANGSGDAYIGSSSAFATVTAARGGAGADATPPAKESRYGCGGTSGHGGGGAGSNGTAEAHQTTSENISVSQASLTASDTQPAPGGRGSDGGEAGDGCIIIYYRKKKEIQSGPLVTSNNLGLLDSLGRRMIV